MLEIAEEWAKRLGIQVREEKEYIRFQEEHGHRSVDGVFLDTISESELSYFIERSKRENCELWGVLPPYTGDDDFPVQTIDVAGRPHILNPEQQRQFRQRPRLIVTRPRIYWTK